MVARVDELLVYRKALEAADEISALLKHFATYLHLSRGSSSETRTQLRVAMGRGYLMEAVRISLSEKYDSRLSRLATRD
jgi:23S rRNA-intervening sequence protein